jgi:hypothetical protein
MQETKENAAADEARGVSGIDRLAERIASESISPSLISQEQEIEFLLSSFRAGIMRARTAAAELEEIGLALRLGMITPAEARHWARFCFGGVAFLDEGRA